MTELRAELDERWSEAWDAMEDAIVKLKELNDLCFDEAGEPLFSVPRIQANVLVPKVKEIKDEVETFNSIKERSLALPRLPVISA